MPRRIVGWVAITGLAVVVAACGAVNPTAVAVTGSSDGEGVATASSRGNLAPMEKPVPCGTLTLTKVAAEANWVTVRAEWLTGNGKAFGSACAVPVFSVTPQAKMFTPRYDPNQVTIWGPVGVYTIMAATGDNSKPALLDVYIK
jgi:alcohol dehydrogenase YqhD (iron-dependent ADH family)